MGEMEDRKMVPKQLKNVIKSDLSSFEEGCLTRREDSALMHSCLLVCSFVFRCSIPTPWFP